MNQTAAEHEHELSDYQRRELAIERADEAVRKRDEVIDLVSGWLKTLKVSSLRDELRTHANDRQRGGGERAALAHLADELDELVARAADYLSV